MARELPPMDDFAKDAFTRFGYKEPMPPELVELYGRVKTLKDKLTPGRMSCETLALVAVIARDRIAQRQQEGR